MGEKSSKQNRKVSHPHHHDTRSPRGRRENRTPATLAGEARLGGSDACQTVAKTRATLRHIRAETEATATHQGAGQVLPTQTPASPELSANPTLEMSEGGISK